MQWWPFAAAGAALVVLLMPRKAYGYISGKPTEIDVATLGQGGFLMRFDAAVAFRQMAAAAVDAGVTLKVTTAFRSNEHQERLYEMWLAGTGNQAAKPGYSNHQSGVAVDIEVGASFSSPTYRWLEKNAPRFGFVNTGRTFSQPEPWHWEYRPS